VRYRLGFFFFNGCSVGAMSSHSLTAARAMAMTALSGAAGGLVASALTSTYLHGQGVRVSFKAALDGVVTGLVSRDTGTGSLTGDR
jgi:ammonia channel protein AmtB